ncbi:MAG: tocopherol cyclase family protein, partial [Oscillospiraceae bacterium]
MNNYFDGCYFKLQSSTQTVALIPAFHIDSDNKKSASLQIITDSDTYYTLFDSNAFFLSKNPLRIAIGENLFTKHGIRLNIKNKSLTAVGTIKFGAITPLRYDIMGPFRYLPAMECRHSIFSLTHTVNGSLSINGKQYAFGNSVGYIEGDRGRSFPRVYAWTQCNFFDTQPCCVVVSVANIPVGVAAFTGIIGVVLWK